MAGSVLLLIGAGCAAGQQAGTSATGTTAPSPTAVNGQKDEVDAAADAYVSGASDEQTAAGDVSGDAGAVTSTDNELNGYGQAYDTTQF